MPMDDGTSASLIDEVHAEPLAGGKANARPSVRAGKSEDLGWPAIHLEHSCSGDETRRNGGCGAHQTGQDWQDPSSERGAKKVTARVEPAHGQNIVLSGTEAPVALVKRSGFDIMNTHFQKFRITKLIS